MSYSTISQVAQASGYEYATLLARLNRKNIPHVRVGRLILLAPMHVDALLNAKEQKGAAKHPMYRRWKRIMRRCSEPSWRRFNVFLADVGHIEGAMLKRLDKNKPYARDNYEWVCM